MCSIRMVCRLGVCIAVFATIGCGGPEADRRVVVYTSVDRNFSEPLLRRFEERTGIRAMAVYDVEAAKTTGLVNRLLAEKGNPQADVFWNGEIVQTLLLKERGVLQPYASPNAADIPASFRDPENYWTGLAGRARCFLVNTDLLKPEDYPGTLDDLLDPRRGGAKAGVALPLFGTAATHAAVLYRAWGDGRAREWFERLRNSGVQVLDGNSVVRDRVASGHLAFGLTDTDDAAGAVARGAPVRVVFPGQDGPGTLVIPNTVAMVAGAPHPSEARAFIDYLLSRETVAELICSGWCHVPLREVGARPRDLDVSGLRKMAADFSGMHREIERVRTDLREVFGR